jgi:predicted amidophosphoribosyltransferase
MNKESKTNDCPQCEKPLKGCACSHRKADDGKLVHARCLRKYNYILKINKVLKSKNDGK